MKKKKQNSSKRQQPNQEKTESLTLKDALNASVLEKLKLTQQELKSQEDQAKAEEEARKKEERRLREKNKSFEELLNESNTDWRKFK
ncbi:ribosomal protein L14E/L6E/L27E [Bacillus ectoiniformans]|uniref:YqkE family protein n=1 Tax=Bacillus ectoiniformans TaxID=1494429 RepID=UPI001958CF63|nr:YqkE family protein [Bacillus ectoiniformans]MBM7648060.1 ribosomal protein L14E/L6E/L27E [Bacillus ectoiniformans]